MKLTLMIEGSAATIAAVLAALPDADSVGVTITGNALATGIDPTGPASAAGASAPMPTAPSQPAPVAPMPATAAASDDEDDEGGTASDAATDSAGLPWDERIHASTRTTNKDGSWKKRRNVDAAVVAQVEAELRGSSAPPLPGPAAIPTPTIQPVPVPSPMPAPMPAPTSGPMTVPPMPMPVQEQPQPVAPQPVPMPMPAPVSQPVAQVADEPITIQSIMANVAAQMSKQPPLIDGDYLTALTNEIGGAFGQPLGTFGDIQNNPGMMQFAVAAMKRDGRW